MSPTFATQIHPIGGVALYIAVPIPRCRARPHALDRIAGNDLLSLAAARADERQQPGPPVRLAYDHDFDQAREKRLHFSLHTDADLSVRATESAVMQRVRYGHWYSRIGTGAAFYRAPNAKAAGILGTG